MYFSVVFLNSRIAHWYLLADLCKKLRIMKLNSDYFNCCVRNDPKRHSKADGGVRYREDEPKPSKLQHR